MYSATLKHILYPIEKRLLANNIDVLKFVVETVKDYG